jgi:phosphoenolpyruvate-protein phosphotransferase
MTRIMGMPAAGGIAIGPIWRYSAAASAGGASGSAATSPVSPPAATASGSAWAGTGSAATASADAESEIRAAAEKAATQLEALAGRVRDQGRAEDAGIFEAQALMTQDPELLDEAIARAQAGMAAVNAVEAAADAAAATLAALPDELLAARAADVRDVGARIVRIMLGRDVALPVVPSVAIAEDLPPSVAAEIPSGFLLGVVLEGGSVTAHAVILARGLGIPAIVGAAGLMAAAASADSIAMDGGSGEMALDPGAAETASFEARAAALAVSRRAAAALRGRPGATADGRPVALLANIGGPADVRRAIKAGAEGVGLLRTEFLFMSRLSPPSEAEQVAAYLAIFEAFGPDRPVVVRLADIGGDKDLPFLNLPAEANPFLGVRAIRLAAHGHRELLLTQLRAIWRAAGAAGVTPHVMAAMVSTMDDVGEFRRLCAEAREAVAACGPDQVLPERMIQGIMIEVPSAALLAPELARLVDFFSIGTNDLTQYTMAADRGNSALANLQDGLHPAVLRLIRGVVAGADAAGIPVAVCGELGGDPLGSLVLVGLGVDELSADAGSLDAIRAGLAGADSRELAELAERALVATDAAAVRSMTRDWQAAKAGPTGG